MEQVVIFPLDDGHVAVLYPAENCGLSINDIARKDVPQGVPYRIIDRSEVPTDNAFREAWEADFSTPDGHGDLAGYIADLEAAAAETEVES